MNDLHPPRYSKEEISATPTFFKFGEGVVVESLDNVQGPDLVPEFNLSSKPGGNQLDQDFDRQFSIKNIQHHNTIIATDNSFKDEEYIYVSFFFPSSLYRSPPNGSISTS